MALRPAVAAVSLAALALATTARGDGLNASLEPTYRHVETDVTDQAGRTTREVEDGLTQRYRLSFDRVITSYVAAGAGATLVDDRSWSGIDGVSSDGHDRATSLFGRLTLGTPVLSAGVGVDRREQRTFLPSAGGFVVESYAAHAAWRPRDLPELDLQVGRVNAYDRERSAQDATTDTASFGVRYGTREYDLRYLLGWNRADDHVQRSRTTSIEQTALASRTDSLFGGRMFTHVSGTLQSRNASTEREGQGGTVTRLQLPFSGLSAVEVAPASAADVQLAPNPLVVDGDTTTSASVNVGFGPAAGGDRDARDVGAGFADEITAVNLLYVWFDRPLTESVGAALATTAAVWESRDNQTWTPVAIVGPPVTSPLQNRIEITIAETRARFVKIVLRPLPTGLTTDPAYRDLFVTELQLLLVRPVEAVPSEQTLRSASVNAAARTLILRTPDLAHDATLSLARQSEDITTYSVVNGLSLAHRLRPSLAANARGARVDQDVGRGHEGSWQWSAALVGTPLPTARWTLTYSGRATDDGDVGHSLSALARADWYDGISSQASAGVARGVTQIENRVQQTTETQTATSFQSSGRVSLTPNTLMTLSAGAQYSRTLSSSPSGGDVLTQFARVDGTLSLTPAPALSAAGTVSRVLIGARRTTLGTLQLDYFPLRGDLQLAFAYSRTLDTAAEATTELFTPSLRWNVRRGVSLRSSYTFLENDAPAQLLTSRAFEATLLITL